LILARFRAALPAQFQHTGIGADRKKQRARSRLPRRERYRQWKSTKTKVGLDVRTAVAICQHAVGDEQRHLRENRHPGK
jgi:hypothetical protein